MKSILEQIRWFIRDNQSDIVLIIGIILISLISFGAGRLTSQSISKSKQIINTDQNETARNSPAALMDENKPQTSPVQIVGNKNSKIYHYPWCSGAKNMKEENKIIFNSAEEAKNAGYIPAGNCPGL